MATFNSFRIIGICYNDSIKVLKKSCENEYYTKATLVVKTTFNTKVNYVPLIFTGKLAEKAAILLRNGNLVSVTGEIASQERFNRITGETLVEITFVCNDIMLLQKSFKKRLSTKEFAQEIEAFSPDEYSPERKKNDKRRIQKNN